MQYRIISYTRPRACLRDLAYDHDCHYVLASSGHAEGAGTAALLCMHDGSSTLCRSRADMIHADAHQAADLPQGSRT